MKLSEAMAAGYKRGDRKAQRGQVEAPEDVMNLEVHTAGGSRRGELYILLPMENSFLYCWRQYLRR